MTEFEFTLAINGNLDDHKLDRLFEAGLGDASFVGTTGPVYATLHRKASSLVAAVLSAVRQIESVEGLRVEGLDADDLVSMAEIADRLGRSRESVRLLIAGERGAGGFPAPVVGLRDRTKLWQWTEVAEWIHQNLHLEVDPGTSVAPTINAALALRRGESKLSEQERRALLELV